jgi:hypothetical protein
MDLYLGTRRHQKETLGSGGDQTHLCLIRPLHKVIRANSCGKQKPQDVNIQVAYLNIELNA